MVSNLKTEEARGKRVDLTTQPYDSHMSKNNSHDFPESFVSLFSAANALLYDPFHVVHEIFGSFSTETISSTVVSEGLHFFFFF